MEKPKQDSILSIPEVAILRWIDEQYPDSGMAESVKGYLRNILDKEFFYLAKDRSADWFGCVNTPYVGLSQGQWFTDGNEDESMWSRISGSLADVFDSRLGSVYSWQQLFKILPAYRKVVIHEGFEL